MRGKILSIITVVLGLILVFTIFAQAEEKSWDFEKWQTSIQINRNSTFVVEEEQTINFYGNFHWLKRDISKQRVREISDIKVFDESGRELRGKEIEIKEDEKQVSIKLNFDLTNVQKTWTFKYKVRGGLGYFEEHDELYWNAVSSEREVPIKKVEVFVYLPEEVSKDKIKQRLYIGRLGSTNLSPNYQIVDGKTLKFWGKDISPYENFTIVAGWPKGIIEHPGIVKINSSPEAKVLIDNKETDLKTPVVLEEGYEISSGTHIISVKKFGWKLKDGESKTVLVQPGRIEEIEFTLEKTQWFVILGFLPFLIPLASIIFVFWRWLKSPRIKKTIIAQYEPPDNLASVEVGALVDLKIQSRDITAILIDLAYRGYLRIIEKEKKILWKRVRKYSLEKTKEIDDNLKNYESSLLRAIFGNKKVVKIDELKKKVSLRKKLSDIRKEVFKKLVKDGYLESLPGKGIKVLYVVMGWIFLLGGGLAFIISINLGFAFLVAGIIMVIDSFIRPANLTKEGVEAKWYALGFKEYLQIAERFRLGACTPETFEKYLSYAIAFKVEKKWANRFVDIYKKPPEWFVSSQPISSFHVAGFANNVSLMSYAISSGVTGAMASGSSGFGGGGFAGGGGGGGGSSAG